MWPKKNVVHQKVRCQLIKKTIDLKGMDQRKSKIRWIWNIDHERSEILKIWCDQRHGNGPGERSARVPVQPTNRLLCLGSLRNKGCCYFTSIDFHSVFEKPSIFLNGPTILKCASQLFCGELSRTFDCIQLLRGDGDLVIFVGSHPIPWLIVIPVFWWPSILIILIIHVYIYIHVYW